jgi:hypothetical protein
MTAQLMEGRRAVSVRWWFNIGVMAVGSRAWRACAGELLCKLPTPRRRVSRPQHAAPHRQLSQPHQCLFSVPNYQMQIVKAWGAHKAALRVR